MNPIDIFFGGGNSSAGGSRVPPMPRNAGQCANVAGNHMPAQKLLNITAMSASNGTVVAITPAHRLDSGSVGTVRISGANESVFNGAFNYQVIDASTITFSISSGTASNATGNWSACVDVFEGDYYQLPSSFRYADGNGVKRFDKNGNEVWAFGLEGEGILQQILGVSMMDGGDLAICSLSLSGNVQTLTVKVWLLNKKTGVKRELSSIQSTFSNSDSKTFPTDSWEYPNPNAMTFRAREVSGVFLASTPDITRTFFEVLSDNNFYLSSIRFKGLSSGSSDIAQNSECEFFNQGNPIARVVTDAGGRKVGFPIQYASKDRRVHMGKVFTPLDAQGGDRTLKLFNVSRGGVSAVAYIRHDPVDFMYLGRYKEFDTDLFWIDSAVATDEPVKVYSMGDYVFFSACPPNFGSGTIENTLMLGSSFLHRSDFDEWLNAVCDVLGLPE